MRHALYLFTSLLLAEPRLQNFQQQTRAVTGSLDAAIRSLVAAQVAPAWIGYAVPIVPGERQMCCWNDSAMGCALEPTTDGALRFPAPATVHLEGGTELFVLLRVENRRVEKVRTLTVDCALDGGGLPLHWFTGVNPAQSVAWLETLAGNSPAERKLAERVVGAIALHRDPAADAALDRLTTPDKPEGVRRQAAFWLGNVRGRRGYESLARLVRTEPNDEVREHVVFALSQSKEPEALTLIGRVAREDRSPRVRSKSLFWLAKRGPKATAEAAIRTALIADTDASVRKQAVFALGQIPDGGGVPALIEVARSSRDEAVRRQAVFWLGKSKDARATRFFEDVLSRR